MLRDRWTRNRAVGSASWKISTLTVDGSCPTVVLVDLQTDCRRHTAVLRVDNFGFAERRLRRWQERGACLEVAARPRTRQFDLFEPDSGEGLCLADLTLRG